MQAMINGHSVTGNPQEIAELMRLVNVKPADILRKDTGGIPLTPYVYIGSPQIAFSKSSDMSTWKTTVHAGETVMTAEDIDKKIAQRMTDWMRKDTPL